MNYPDPLHEATVLRRYKRYLCDLQLPDGREVTAHCPNPGRMTSCMEEGAPARLLYAPSPRRKLDWTLEQVQIGPTWIGVHPGRANDVVDEALQAGRIPALAGADRIEREVKVGGSRVDFRLWFGDAPCWVEVKQVSLRDDEGYGAFPDAVSARGLKHLHELSERVEQGERAVLLFAVARGDVHTVRPADEVDPAYASGFRAAMDAGLEVLAHRIDVQPDGLLLSDALPVIRSR